MAENQRTDPAAEPQRATVQVVYTNTAGVQGGPFDVGIDFGYKGYAAVSEDDDADATRWAVRVAMSWEHARALHTLLGEQLEAYEEQVGDLPDISKLRAGDSSANG
jgi:hypothetical protein